MKIGKKKTSLLAKYSEMYKRKPRSRVFAPLAEAHRQLGQYDEAFQILKSGLKNHPGYVLGHIVLSKCYYDKQNFVLAYKNIKPYIESNRENISLQKLFAKSCTKLAYFEEALETYKYLLLLNPNDEEIADQVRRIEHDLHEGGEEPNFTTSEVFVDEDQEDGESWSQIQFEQGDRKLESPEEFDQWQLKKDAQDPLHDFKNDIKNRDLEVEEKPLDDRYYDQEFDAPEGHVEAQSDLADPIITHTLVDLYLSQGHKEKAIQLLEDILELHPKDGESKARLSELKTSNLSEESSQLETSPAPELYDFIAQNQNKSDIKQKELLNKLNLFYQKIINLSESKNNQL